MSTPPAIEALLAVGRWHDAEPLLRQEINSRPGDAQLHYDLAVTLHQLGSVAAADREFRATLALDPDHAHALYYRGAIAEATDPSRALRFYEQAVEAHPNHRSALAALSRLRAAPPSAPSSLLPQESSRPPRRSAQSETSPAAPIEPAPPDSQPPRRPRDPKALVGRASKFRERTEGYAGGAFAIRVWTFRLKTTAPGLADRMHSIELRGSGLVGSIDDGDWVEIPRGAPRQGEGLQPSKLFNLSTGEEVRTRALKTLLPTGDRRRSLRVARWAALAALLTIAVALGLTWRGIPFLDLAPPAVEPGESASRRAESAHRPDPPAERILVPDVLGDEEDDARHQIEGAGLRVGDITYVENAGSSATKVTAQSPRAGTLTAPNAALDITVSRLPADIAVPDLANQYSFRDARDAKLRPLGLEAEWTSGTDETATVSGQDPTAGTLVRRGQVVRLS